MTCHLFSEKKIISLTEKMRNEVLPIPRDVHTFYRKHVMISAVHGECFAEYYQPYHGTLLLRLFCLSVDRSDEKRMLQGNITEYGRCILGGNFIVTNVAYAGMNGYSVIHSCGNENMDDSGWCVDENYELDKNNRSWFLRPYGEGINLHKVIRKYVPYCAYEEYTGRLAFFDYLVKYLKYPGIEMLVKLGFSNFISCLNILNLNGRNFEEIFKVDNKWKNYLKGKYAGKNDLVLLRRYPWLKDEADLGRVYEILGLYTKNGKPKNYVPADRQYEFSEAEWDFALRHYELSQISLYSDYLIWAKKLGYPLNESKWHFPKTSNKLMELHDKAYKEIEIVKNEKYDKDIALFSKEAEKFNFSSNGLLIRPTQSSSELIRESEVLNHCVRTYCNKVAKGQSMIFFIRKSDDPGTPYCTLEMDVTKKHIIQVRAYHNDDPSKEVKSFIHQWSKKFDINGNYA